MATMLLSSLFLVMYLQTATADSEKAIADCLCHIYHDANLGLQTADCQDKNLTTIPDCVPNNTQWLQLGENNLRYSPGQFQRFGNLLVLDLGYNPKFAAKTDSFRSLFSLVYLELGWTDLSNLTGDTFLNLSNLKRLGLAGRMGKLNMPKTLFNYLGNLKRLDLSSYDQLLLPNWSFETLPLLSYLDLQGVNCLKLHNYTFSGLSALTYIDLKYTPLTSDVPIEVFKPLVSLKKLHWEGLCSVLDPASDCSNIDQRLQYAPSLEKLYIDKRLASNLGKGFLALNYLQELYLVNSVMTQACNVPILKSETFTNLRNSPLTKLVLNRCNIEVVYSGWFAFLPTLTQISLSITTDIYSMNWEEFSTGLENTKLSTISLSLVSKSVYVQPEPLVIVRGFNETKLTTLELTDAMFNSVDDDAIASLPKSLRKLNLNHNYIVLFGVESLIRLENLETLDLTNQVDINEYSAKRHDTFASSHQTKSRKQTFSSLFLNRTSNVCRINELHQRIQSYFNATKTKCLSLPRHLKVLNLSKTRLLCNMVPAFCDLNNSLQKLDASHQRGKSCFESRSFWSVLKNLAKLEELNLNGNSISEIPHDTFVGLSKLRKLMLVDNKLLELSFEVKDLISLEIMNLTDNSIRYASESFITQIENIPSNITLYLDKNPMVCNCKHIDFLAWLIGTEVISNKKRLNCTFENETRISVGGLSQTYENLKYKCSMPDVIIGCTVMFCGLNVLLGGLAYVWHNRQKLRYLVLFGRRTLNPYHPIEENEVQMEYDVYISYEGDFNVTRDKTLRDFVIYTILPGLEQRGIRVMIREELDAGRNLYEIITHTVRRSNKVLVLMTNDYCSDMWNVFEFNQAIMEGIYTNRQIAIPVLFESLNYDKVKEEIRAFLQMEPVHRYSPELRDKAFIDFLYERIRDTRKFD